MPAKKTPRKKRKKPDKNRINVNVQMSVDLRDRLRARMHEACFRSGKEVSFHDLVAQYLEHGLTFIAADDIGEKGDPDEDEIRRRCCQIQRQWRRSKKKQDRRAGVREGRVQIDTSWYPQTVETPRELERT